MFDRPTSHSSMFDDFPPPPPRGNSLKGGYDEPSIDVNDLVKKIDAKLEELEREEAEENKAKDNKETKKEEFKDNRPTILSTNSEIKEAKTEPVKKENKSFGISTKDIEAKVNKKLSGIDDDFDILSPIEKEKTTEPKKTSISKYDDDIESLDDDLFGKIDNKISKLNNEEPKTEPRSELRLDDQDDDEKFFDDFFDD